MIIGATLGRYFSKRFAKTILVVFGTVFALVYTIDFVELMRRGLGHRGHRGEDAWEIRACLQRNSAHARRLRRFPTVVYKMSSTEPRW